LKEKMILLEISKFGLLNDFSNEQIDFEQAFRYEVYNFIILSIV